MLTKAIQNHGATLKRGLGLLLVVFIFYGTTVEAAHRHGVAVPQSNSAASVINPNSDASSTSNARPGCSDCLICQLHQHFNTTLLAFRVADPPAQVCVNTPAALPRDVLSQVTGTPAGRAPPSIS